MLSKIKTPFVYVGFGLTLLLMILFIYLMRTRHRAIRRIWAKVQKYVVGYDIEIVGEPSGEAKLLLVNHQSMLDIVVLEDIHPADLAWIAKKEIGKIPLFGHILRAPKMIEVDRNDKRSLIQLLKDVKDRIDNGRVVAMFPEGTRGRGDKLLKFKEGAKMIAEKHGLLVQPVIVINTRNILDSKNFETHGGTTKVIYLDPVKADKTTDWYAQTYELMQKIYSENNQ
jgi:1-acyl-sn-glycerol-3-phosphate acyltransferase